MLMLSLPPDPLHLLNTLQKVLLLIQTVSKFRNLKEKAVLLGSFYTLKADKNAFAGGTWWGSLFAVLTLGSRPLELDEKLSPPLHTRFMCDVTG